MLLTPREQEKLMIYVVADLARKIRRYIRLYNKAPKPIRWAYRNPARRISSTSASTVH